MLLWRSSISRRVRIIGPTISPTASAVTIQMGQVAVDPIVHPPPGAAANVRSAPRTATGTRTG